jgi:hypothetical protein
VLIQSASTSTSSKRYRSVFDQGNSTTPSASAPAPTPEDEPTHPDLETQLLDARVALVKYEQELGIKDDQIFQANQEIERLNTRYTDTTDYIESGEPAILMLKESSKKHIEKMNRQRVQIDNLHIHNRRLKSMLQNAGIRLDSEMDWAALRSECQAHKEFYMRQGGDEKSWKATWETNGKEHAAWPGHTSLGVKGVSAGDHPPPRRSNRKNDFDNDVAYGTDPRSPLGGKVKGQKTIRPSPRKDDSIHCYHNCHARWTLLDTATRKERSVHTPVRMDSVITEPKKRSRRNRRAGWMTSRRKGVVCQSYNAAYCSPYIAQVYV